MHLNDASTDRVPPVLYHVTSTVLPVGAVLHPYTLGQETLRLLRRAEQVLAEGPDAIRPLLAGAEWSGLTTGGGYRAEMVVLEAAFERVRVRITPDLPSRYGVVFAWDTLARAAQYRIAYCPTGLIHHCSLVMGRSLVRDGSLVVEASETTNLITPRHEDLLQLEEHAERYWLGQGPMAFPEVLVQGTVVVEGIVAD